MYGLIKTLDTGGGKKIKLAGNALTFILYKGYFGRDLLNDIVGFASKNVDPSVVRKFQKFNIQSIAGFESLNLKQQTEVLHSLAGYYFDSEFVLNFVAALIATARYPEKPDVIDVIMEIPPHWVSDKEIITELLEFLSLFITQKKTASGSR